MTHEVDIFSLSETPVCRFLTVDGMSTDVLETQGQCRSSAEGYQQAWC